MQINKKYPVMLKNKPIKEYIIEIRFESIIPIEAIFGILYDKLKELYSNIEEDDISKIPKDIIKKDIALRYIPHYTLSSKFQKIGIKTGPHVIQFFWNESICKEYPGWMGYISKEVNKAIDEVFDTIGNKIERVAIRSIDLFGGNLFENINLKINTEQGINLSYPVLSFNNQNEEFRNAITISSAVQNMSNVSILDIDTFVENENKITNKDSLKNLIQKIHDVNKSTFFDLVKKEYYDEVLGADYELS
jgi:uncharacterized protein (TIGR04255 family)